ncbi:hypothetical protein [Paraburkholderia aromaticivorans]|uniref:hypothetical protein n=1 Tax=Paraburkholderia aromaticivorans TaxID=2026199 RepID=UPI0038B8A2F8
MHKIKLDIEINQPDRARSIATLEMLVEELKDNPYCFAGFGEHLQGSFAFTASESNDEDDKPRVFKI